MQTANSYSRPLNETKRNYMLRTYKIIYKILPSKDIDDLVAVDHSEYGKKMIQAGRVIYGSRPVIPANTHIKAANEKNGFFKNLEASILNEGFRNSIFCIATKEGIFSVYGTTRLWVAKKHNLDIPCIVADYDNIITDGEELTSKEEVLEKFADAPSNITIEDDKMNIYGCIHYHLGEYIAKVAPSDKEGYKEKDKYTRMWMNKSYRSGSPGEHHLEHFMKYVNPVGSVIDFGSGSGRASLKMHQKGLDVTMVDIASNSTDPVVQNNLCEKFKFAECSLWDMDNLEAEYGYCCDVMEHIPTDKLDKVLQNIYKAVNQAVFFSISTVPDIGGKLINETLHLTVKPLAWWEERLVDAGWKLNVTHVTSGQFNVICTKGAK